MNPATLRTLPAAALLAGTALTATQAAQAAHAASAASTTPAARADDDGGGLAGTRAGEGRTHPGRTRPPAPSPSDEDPSAGPRDGDRDGDGNESESDEGTGRFSLVPEWTPSSLPMPQRPDRHQAREPLPSGQPYGAQRTAAEPSERAMRVLPLGTGLALTGLGLGLAFFGLRLRRR
ncbi:hypothetical protein ACFYOY_05635 [Streptomyces sp. NPDC007875]|uniref:hypothetical protein n=1 Tax=Streptomyces sp. NPDC007875 TaxID=3364783 RepID=UPI0036B94CD0